MIRVVSGALVRDGRVLMGLRKSDGLRPDLWETPGGKVEDGETPESALAREWREELGVDVVATHLITSAVLSLERSCVVELHRVELVVTGVPGIMLYTRVPGDGGTVEPRPLDHQRLGWADPSHAVRWLPCSPAFYLHHQDLRDHVEATRELSTCDYCGGGCSDEACLHCHPTREKFLADFERSTTR